MYLLEVLHYYIFCIRERAKNGHNCRTLASTVSSSEIMTCPLSIHQLIVFVFVYHAFLPCWTTWQMYISHVVLSN